MVVRVWLLTPEYLLPWPWRIFVLGLVSFYEGWLIIVTIRDAIRGVRWGNRVTGGHCCL